jgi:hypothetical protein
MMGAVLKRWAAAARRLAGWPLIAGLIAVGGLGVAGGFGAARAAEDGFGWLGVEARTVTRELAEQKGLDVSYGVLMETVAPGSSAAADLAPGDVVIELGGKAVQTAEEFEAALRALPPSAEVHLVRLRQGEKPKRLSLRLVPLPRQETGSVEVPRAMKAQGEPLLRLDPGGHMAKIQAVAFTPDGAQIVSASEDKTIRVWDIASGKTVRVIRGEAGAGPAGKVYAMALSSDGKWLATGGWLKNPGQSGHYIRLYDFVSGRMAALLKGHENVVNSLTFSPDGRRLISGSADTTAIVWDVAAGKALHRLKGHRDHIYAVGFTPDGARRDGLS